MTNMVEKVALAIWQAREAELPPRLRRMTPDALDMEAGAWARSLAQARAAILAMREPTEEVLAAGKDWGGPHEIAKDDAAHAWQAMIDAALSPPQSEQEG